MLLAYPKSGSGVRCRETALGVDVSKQYTCFGFPIAIVRADAAYFSYALLNYLRTTLQAGFVIDYNLRKQGKKALATFCPAFVNGAFI